MPYGQDAKLAIAFQNSRDTTANVGSVYLIPFLSESVEPQRPELLSQNMEGQFDEGEDYGGARQVAGTIVSESQPITVGVFLKALLGDPVSVTSDAIYTHTFKPKTADYGPKEVNQPMSAFKNLAVVGDEMLVFDNLVATRGELRIANGEFLQMTLDVTGGRVATKVGSNALGSAVGKKWTWDVTSLQLGGAANTDFSDITVTIDEQSSSRWVLKTSKDPDRVKRDGRRQVRVSGTVKFVDQTEYDLFLASTTQALSLTMTGPTEIQSGYYDTLRIVAPAFKYLTYPIGFQDPSEKLVGFEGKAEYHTGSACSIAITLINTQDQF